MKKQEDIIQKLLEKKLISLTQIDEVETYRSLGIFSLRNELLFLLYLSVLSFTSGIGVLVYKNIDTIGHSIIIGVLFLVILACLYFSFKKSNGFSPLDVDFDNPVYNYVVLTANILSCIFVGYIQFQYQLFGSDYSLATLFSALISFLFAYYFNNKSALSIAITGLATSIGITITPKTILVNELYSNPNLSYYGLALGILLLVWCYYSDKINLKKHFHLVFLTFSLHLISICCIAGLLEDYWFVFPIIFGVFSFYFFHKSKEISSLSIFVFTTIYSYVGLNIVLFKIFEYVDFSIFGEFLIIFSPFYYIGSIILFIKLVKNFNKNSHDSN